MKKLILLAAFTVFGFCIATAQDGIKFSLNGAYSLGDQDEVTAAAFTEYGFGVDVYKFWEIGPVSVGPGIGYHHFFGREITEGLITIEYDNFRFFTMTGSARFYILDELFFGGDVGYAMALDEINDGGFHYRPKVGYNIGAFTIHASYWSTEIDFFDDQSLRFSSLGLGVEFGF